MRALVLASVLPLLAQTPAGWTRPYPAHRVAGNVYFVGTEDLACFLVTDPAGHILINTGLAGSAPQIKASVEQLGFRFRDIKILLTMQGHFDHVAGFAEVVTQTGAQLWVTEPDAAALEDGGRSDPFFGPDTYFPPVKVSRRLRDGEVVRLGATELKVHLTPGHSRGSVSYATTVTEDGRKRSFLFVNVATVVMPLAGNRKYPEIVQDYEKTFTRQKSWRPDIWVAAHGSQYKMDEKYRKGSFVDPAGYVAMVSRSELDFRKRLKAESAKPGASVQPH